MHRLIFRTEYFSATTPRRRKIQPSSSASSSSSVPSPLPLPSPPLLPVPSPLPLPFPPSLPVPSPLPPFPPLPPSALPPPPHRHCCREAQSAATARHGSITQARTCASRARACGATARRGRAETLPSRRHARCRTAMRGHKAQVSVGNFALHRNRLCSIRS